MYITKLDIPYMENLGQLLLMAIILVCSYSNVTP